MKKTTKTVVAIVISIAVCFWYGHSVQKEQAEVIDVATWMYEICREKDYSVEDCNVEVEEFLKFKQGTNYLPLLSRF